MAYIYAKKDSGIYEQRLTQETLTSLIETPDNQMNWLNAQSFETSTIGTSGYKPHTRDKGFNSGKMANKKDVYTLSFDRDIEFFVDKADVDETAQDLAAARVTNTFITDQAGPELDAYRFSKMAHAAIENSNGDDTTLTVDNVYSTIKKSILPIRKYKPGNLLTYVSSETMDLLERSNEFNRSITNQNVGLTSLESRVTSLDGVSFVEVWDTDRFGTKYDFTDGFRLDGAGKKINFLVVAKPSIIAKAKFNSIYLFAPGEHTEGDGYLYQNRLYHDLFVLKSRQDGLFVHTK